jgi:hypothetical protein
MGDFQPKLVDTLHYHLWTDALHLRTLAHQARNRWDRGTYVRSTLIAAWTTLETACNDALGVKDIGYSFCRNLNAAIDQKNFPKLDWSQGVWQKASELLTLRKEFVHQGISNRHRFAQSDQADKAINGCRDAIKAIYTHVGKAAPAWVDDDYDPGFEEKPGGSFNLSVIRGGADPNHPDTVRIVYVYKDQERLDGNYPPGTDHKPLLDDLIRRMRVPISNVRAYRGNDLLEERELLMRGN